MTCKELIESIINDPAQKGYSMDEDDARKLIALAYYMGRESAVREVCDQAAAIFAAQINRADQCRYHNLAHNIQGGITKIYHSDYSGDFTSTFGSDPTAQTAKTLAK